MDKEEEEKYYFCQFTLSELKSIEKLLKLHAVGEKLRKRVTEMIEHIEK